MKTHHSQCDEDLPGEMMNFYCQNFTMNEEGLIFGCLFFYVNQAQEIMGLNDV